MPSGVVGYMREKLGVGRAVRDRARRSAPRPATLSTTASRGSSVRTLVTLDRDYLDDRQFPPRRERG
jgi:hypothetical protein